MRYRTSPLSDLSVPQAVELYFDQATERKLRQLLEGLAIGGIQVTNGSRTESVANRSAAVAAVSVTDLLRRLQGPPNFRLLLHYAM